MRSKIKLILLVTIPILSCESKLQPKETKPSVVASMSANILPSSTPSPSITPSQPSTPIPTISPKIYKDDHAKIAFPNDFNQDEYIKDFIFESLEDKLNKDDFIEGKVFDRNNKPIPNVNVSMNIITYDDKILFIKTKTNENGEYLLPKIKTIINITVSKSGFTERNQIYYVYNQNQNYYFGNIESNNSISITNELKKENFNKFLSINNEPEITNIVINSQKISPFNIYKIINNNLGNVVFSSDLPNKNIIKTDTSYSRFKIISKDKLEILLDFNKSINKDSLEKNIQIEDLEKTISYDFNTKGASFLWNEDNSSVTFTVPIKKENVDKKYRLGFRQPFIDTQGHKAFEQMYIAIQPQKTISRFTELSENIVFTIAGNN